MLNFIKGTAALLGAVAAILSALVTIRGQWELLLSQPTVGSAVTVAATGEEPTPKTSAGTQSPENNQVDPKLEKMSTYVGPMKNAEAPAPEADQVDPKSEKMSTYVGPKQN